MSGETLSSTVNETIEEDGEDKVKRILARLGIMLGEFEMNPPPLDGQYVETEHYKEIADLSAQLVALGAAECPTPSTIVAAALVVDRSAKHLTAFKEREARIDQLRAKSEELLNESMTGEIKRPLAVYKHEVEELIKELEEETAGMDELRQEMLFLIQQSVDAL